MSTSMNQPKKVDFGNLLIVARQGELAREIAELEERRNAGAKPDSILQRGNRP